MGTLRSTEVWLRPHVETLGFRNDAILPPIYKDRLLVRLKAFWDESAGFIPNDQVPGKDGKVGPGTLLSDAQSKDWVPVDNDYFLLQLQDGIDYMKKRLPDVPHKLEALQMQLDPNCTAPSSLAVDTDISRSRSPSFMDVKRRRLVDRTRQQKLIL